LIPKLPQSKKPTNQKIAKTKPTQGSFLFFACRKGIEHRPPVWLVCLDLAALLGLILAVTSRRQEGAFAAIVGVCCRRTPALRADLATTAITLDLVGDTPLSAQFVRRLHGKWEGGD